MIVFLVFLGASSPACNRSPANDPAPIRFEDDACPVGRFATTGEHAGCRCPDEQDKRIGGPFDMFAQCRPRPTPAMDEPVVDITCNEPPADCTYEGRVLSGSASEVSCGTLVCPEPVCSIHCAEAPSNCRYIGQVVSGACGEVTCGKLLCEETPRCKDGERRLEACWAKGIRGQARHLCRDGRWHRDECEIVDPLQPVGVM